MPSNSAQPSHGCLAPETAAPILLAFAVKEEARPFLSREADQARVRMFLTGMGPANAERAITRMLERLAPRSPRLVISAGFAGGLNPALPTGAVLFSATAAPALADRLSRLRARPARFHCSDRILTYAREKAELHRQTGADAVEMESGVIQRVCAECGVPSLVVRVISDAATEDLPLDFNRLMKPDDRLSYYQMALALTQAPGKILALLRFQRQTQRASANLAAVLDGLLAERDRLP